MSAAADPAGIAHPRHRVRSMLGVQVPMRDGVHLATDVYLPDGAGRYPVILIRTPYNKNNEAEVADAIFFASRGYAVAIQDCRGRFDSDGDWTPFVNEALDGYDAQTWCGTQPWSSGKVGTSGGSYVALTQWMPAPLRNPHLAAMAPQVGFSNLYHNWVYTGGAFQLAFNLRWGPVQMRSRVNQVRHLWLPPEQHLSAFFDHLPIIEADENAGGAWEPFKDWVRHPDYGPYWESLGNIEVRYPDVDVPAYGFGGWYDVFLQGTLNNFMGVRAKGHSERARRGQKVLIGPWIHCLGDRGTNSRTGDIDFGAEALLDLRVEELRWFDYWLKGIDNGILDEPPVRVFVMGANRWRLAREWPIPGTRAVAWYLHSKGGANSSQGDGRLDRNAPSEDEAPDRFRVRPARPGADDGGQHLLLRGHHSGADGAAGSARGGMAPGCAGVRQRGSRAGPRGHRSDKGRALRRLHRSGHRLHRQAGRRVPVGVRNECRPGHHPGALPRLLDRAVADAAGRNLPVRDRLLVLVEPFPPRTPHPGGDLLFELPSVRPQSEHRPSLRARHGAAVRYADRVSRPPAPFPRSAARRRRSARRSGTGGRRVTEAPSPEIAWRT